MIQFKPIELGDKETIEKYTYLSTNRCCSLTFAHLFAWPGYAATHWAVVNQFLVIRLMHQDRLEMAYLQPIGEGDFRSLLPLLQEDANNFGSPFRIYTFGSEDEVEVRRFYGEEYAVYEDRALAEYIYWAEDLRTLPGRKYQPKRNHFKNFTTRYLYRYEELTPSHFTACLQLDEQWRKRLQVQMNKRVMQFDRQALEQAFLHWNELELQGGVLYVGKCLVAFTYGARINQDTFDVMMEKGDMDYVGVYAAINRLFVEHLAPEYLYVNREEDMGLGGLRSSKLSYYPIKLLPIQRMLYLGEREKACKKLWKEVFQDEDRWIDDFLVNYYRSEQLLSIEEAGEMVSMLHLIPFQMDGLQVGYIYALATSERMRGRGYATRLLQKSIERGRQENWDALVLIPEREELFGYYARWGFQGHYPVEFVVDGGYDFGLEEKERERCMVLPLSEKWQELEKDKRFTLRYLS